MSEELKEQFVNATNSEKIAMLLSYAMHLTILIREEYNRSGHKYEKYNETLHRIISQVLALVVQTDERYPDDVFIDMLSAGAIEKGILNVMNLAFTQGRKKYELNLERSKKVGPDPGQE